MKFTALLLIVAVVAISALGQTKKPAAKPQQKPASAKPATKKPSTPIAKKLTQPKPVSTPKPVDENAEFEAALSAEPLERVNALKKFIVGFPNSERTPKAKELLVVARASVADDKLRSGETETAVSLFILAVDGAPEPIPDKLFADVISKFPYNLYFGGQKPEALAIASKIESRVSTNAAQLVTLAKFHASIENGGEAIRVAEIAVNLDPNSSPAYQAIGLGHRLNFELEKSAAAYSKALELDPESLNSKQSLAEMNRALGKADEAAKLYREMLAVAEGDVPAQTGLVLSLFDGDKKTEAEAEMAKALEANPNNVTLIAGAAYWYSANGDPDKAIELGEKAIALEPRYVWSHIAYARGLAGKQKPVDAERVLIKARSYGNFPTVEFELASARLAAGFYREAVEDLQRSFALKDGNIVVKLGGRTERTGAGFEELLAAERRASIFAPSSGGNATSDQKLKQLLELHKEISASDPDIASIATTVDEFTSGTDSMKVHRQLYAASLLLQKNVALDKVVDVARSATGNTDSGLDSPNAGSAVMASELYESRSLAFSRNEFLLVPEVPRQTLSVILRGRVEDIAGWALYQQSKYPDAIVRLRRAVSVLPNPSAWWRASTWRLGAALAADGKEKEALDSYIASYSTDKPDLAKYSVVESMYKRVNNGSTDGLDVLIGKERVVTIAGSIAPITAPVAETKVEDQATSVETAPKPVEAARLLSIPRGVPIDRSTIAPKAEVLSAPPAAESVEPKPEPTPTDTGLTNDPQVLKEIEKPKPEPEPSPSGTPDTIKTQPDPGAGGLANDPQASKENEKAKPKPAATISGVPEPQAKTEQSGVGSPTTESEDKKLEDAVPPKSEPPPTPVLSNDSEKAKPDAAASPKIESLATPTEPILEPKPSETVEKPNEETLQEETKSKGSEIVKPADSKPETQSKIKPLFDPIIIPIPNSKASVKPREESSAGAARPRIVEGVEIKAEELPVCKIDVSQENVSLINNGGTIGLIVSVEDETAAKQLLAISSSPNDIDITPEGGNAEPSKQRLYIIKSISTTPGVYQVRFAAACGRRDVIVTVR